MGKYDALRVALLRSDGPVEFAFDEVARLVGGLPRSAYTYREWWANEQRGSHVQARAWLDAGRRVEYVDLNRQRVRFGTRTELR